MERILSALEGLLRERPFEEISIAEIIAKAGVSAGSFYARFATKNALLPFAYARYSAGSAIALEDQFAGVSWRRLARRARIETLLSFVLDNHGVKKWLLRAMALFARARPGEVTADAADRSEKTLVLSARALGPEAEAKELMRLRFAAYAMTTLAREYVLFEDAPLTKAMAMTSQSFKRELTDMIDAYLQTLGAGSKQG